MSLPESPDIVFTPIPVLFLKFVEISRNTNCKLAAMATVTSSACNLMQKRNRTIYYFFHLFFLLIITKIYLLSHSIYFAVFSAISLPKSLSTT